MPIKALITTIIVKIIWKNFIFDDEGVKYFQKIFGLYLVS